MPSNPKERFAAMLEFLHNDELWASEYGTFVLQVSFAGPGETISFAGSVLRGAYNPAKHHSKIAQRRAAGTQSSVLPLPLPSGGRISDFALAD